MPFLFRYEVFVDTRCECGHNWDQHTRDASGAQPCRHFGCGCHNFLAYATEKTVLADTEGEAFRKIEKLYPDWNSVALMHQLPVTGR